MTDKHLVDIDVAEMLVKAKGICHSNRDCHSCFMKDFCWSSAPVQKETFATDRAKLAAMFLRKLKLEKLEEVLK